jgi:hypothetical protein
MAQVRRGGEQFETTIEADHRGQLIQKGPDSGMVDAFGRQRFSEPFTLFDSMLRYSKRTDQWDEAVVGSGSTNYLVNESSIELKTTVASGDTALRRTRKHFPYQPGKALKNGEPVLTPAGWVPIESLSVGDEVFDGLGNITSVVGVYPQGERELFRITFDDGTTIDADGDHLWVAIRRHDSQKYKKGDRYTLTTRQMIEAEGNTPSVQNRWRIPCCPVLKMPSVPISIDPYTLGAILGDGSIAHCASPTFTTADEEMLEYIVCDKITKRQGAKYAYGLLGLSQGIREYGLQCKDSFAKFIPEKYKFNCESVRLEILKGLMDTDGWIEKDACTYFGSVSRQLAEDVAFLVRSLGGTAKMSQRSSSFYYNKVGTKIECAVFYKLAICMPENPFKLKRKANQWRAKYRTSMDRYIYSIEPVGAGEATCIRVASEDHTFITKNHIVTHNSIMVLASFVGNTPMAGLVQEVGYFDDDNGVILRANGEQIELAVRSFTTGSAQETVVPQSAWNIDTLPSFDFSKANILITDLEWLGVGRVRMGFVIDGEIIYCHEFNHANNIDSVYMTSAILPLSYRIYNFSSIAAPARLKQICSSVVSEGGYQPTGPIYIAGNGVAGFAAISSETMVAAIRMASGRTDNVIIPAQIDVSLGGNPSANAVAQWRLRLNPTISGTWLDATNGRGNVQTMSTGTFSGGTVIGAGLVASRSAIEFDPESGLALSLGQSINGTSDVIALTIECSSSQNATGLLGWREVV